MTYIQNKIEQLNQKAETYAFYANQYVGGSTLAEKTLYTLFDETAEYLRAKSAKFKEAPTLRTLFKEYEGIVRPVADHAIDLIEQGIRFDAYLAGAATAPPWWPSKLFTPEEAERREIVTRAKARVEADLQVLVLSQAVKTKTHLWDKGVVAAGIGGVISPDEYKGDVAIARLLTDNANEKRHIKADGHATTIAAIAFYTAVGAATLGIWSAFSREPANVPPAPPVVQGVSLQP